MQTAKAPHVDECFLEFVRKWGIEGIRNSMRGIKYIQMKRRMHEGVASSTNGPEVSGELLGADLEMIVLT